MQDGDGKSSFPVTDTNQQKQHQEGQGQDTNDESTIQILTLVPPKSAAKYKLLLILPTPINN